MLSISVQSPTLHSQRDAPLETGFPNLSRLSSSSSDLNDDPSDPRVMSGNVRPMTVSFDADAAGEARSAVSDDAGILSPIRY